MNYKCYVAMAQLITIILSLKTLILMANTLTIVESIWTMLQNISKTLTYYSIKTHNIGTKHKVNIKYINM